MENLNKIREVYERIQNEFLSMSPFGPMNTKEYRLQFKERLENEFIGYEDYYNLYVELLTEKLNEL